MGGFVDVRKATAPWGVAKRAVQSVRPSVIGTDKGPRATTALGHRHAAMAASVAEHSHLMIFAAHRQQGRTGGLTGDIIADGAAPPTGKTATGAARSIRPQTGRRCDNGRPARARWPPRYRWFYDRCGERSAHGVGVIQNQGHIRLVSDVASPVSPASGAGPVHRHTAAVSRPANRHGPGWRCKNPRPSGVKNMPLASRAPVATLPISAPLARSTTIKSSLPSAVKSLMVAAVGKTTGCRTAAHRRGAKRRRDHRRRSPRRGRHDGIPGDVDIPFQHTGGDDVAAGGAKRRDRRDIGGIFQIDCSSR